jgi:hypothetical protein
MSAADQDSKLVEAVARAIAEAWRLDALPSEQYSANEVDWTDWLPEARSVVPIMLEAAAKVADRSIKDFALTGAENKSPGACAAVAYHAILALKGEGL